LAGWLGIGCIPLFAAKVFFCNNGSVTGLDVS